MRIQLVLPTLAIGGSQIVGIELARGLSDRDHSVGIVAPNGVLETMVREARLPIDVMPAVEGPRPSLAAAAHIRGAVHRHRPDVVIAFESVPIIESLLGATLALRVPTVGVVMSMKVPDRMPRGFPLIVGTQAQGSALEKSRRGRVDVIVPPVVLRPERSAVGTDHAASHPRVRLVMVSRLDDASKTGPVLAAIEACSILASEFDLSLELVGGGAKEGEIRGAADAANAQSGTELVTMHGSQLDPVPFYQGRDIVLGLGHSLLRGMGMGLAGVVVDSGGFAEVVDRSTVDVFLDRGFVGDRTDSPQVDSRELVGALRPLLGQPDLVRRLASLGREIVEDHFSLDTAVDRLETIAFDTSSRSGVATGVSRDTLSALVWMAGVKGKRLVSRVAR